MRKPCFYTFFLLLLHLLTVAAQTQDGVVLDTVVAEAKNLSDETADTTAFAVIGTPVPVAVRAVPHTLIDSLKAADDFWYANLAPVKKKAQAQGKTADSPGLFRQKWFRNALWIFVLSSFIAVVVWYLVSSNILLFRREAKKINDDPVEETTDDIFAIRFDKEIALAEEAENYRLAVRLWYLRTLKALADKGFIDYKPGRTNHDYVAHLSGGQYYRDFSRLTRNFEYTWYGQFKLSAEAYQMMRNNYSPFIKDLR